MYHKNGLSTDRIDLLKLIDFDWGKSSKGPLPSDNRKPPARIIRKGSWTEHEDSIVMAAVTTSTEQPFTRWTDLAAQQLPGRVGKQIRKRWVNHLNPNINHRPFSREDDILLWEGRTQLAKRWVELAKTTFQSTRSENQIRDRWYSASFQNFISNEFGPTAYADATTAGRKSSTNSSSSSAAIDDDDLSSDDDEEELGKKNEQQPNDDDDGLRRTNFRAKERIHRQNVLVRTVGIIYPSLNIEFPKKFSLF